MKRYVSVIVFLTLVAVMSARYFSVVSLAFDMNSERFANSMIAASMLNIDMSEEKFGLNILSSDGTIYDGIGKDSWKVQGVEKHTDGALYLVYHSQEFMNRNVEIASVRKQQLGIQGWLVYYLSRLWHAIGRRISPQYWYFLLRTISITAFAVVITAITFELYKAYGYLFAVCFYVTCFISVWLTNFSSNLYWVSFTWFLPMLFGIMSMNHHRMRIFTYILLFLSVALKALCGYEYISNVMMCAVLFPLVEYLGCPLWDTLRRKQMFRVTLGTGFFAAAGFAAAFIFHAYVRGNGSIIQGVSEIYHADALRRTLGLAGDKNAMKASLHIVLARYFLPPSGWGVVSVAVLSALSLYDAKKRHNVSVKHDAYLLSLSFWSSLSWFVLAKVHSYVHIHINHVLWMLPFIPTALYVFLRQRIMILIPDTEKRNAIRDSIFSFTRRMFWLS